MMHTRYAYCRGVAGLIVLSLCHEGQILSLAQFAQAHGITTAWVTAQARRLERDGVITLERTAGRGHPYLVKPGPHMGPISEEICHENK